MNRLDQEIARQAYILDCLRALRNIYETGDCNVCASRKDCEYVPNPGQMVRYNCPFYKAENEDKEKSEVHKMTELKRCPFCGAKMEVEE